MTTKLAGSLKLAVLVCLGVAVLFLLEQRVNKLESQRNSLRIQLSNGIHTLRILKAEWSYLASPSRLVSLNNKHLGMLPIEPIQLMRMEQLAKKIESTNPELMPK